MIPNPKSRLEACSDGVMAISGTLCAAPASRQRKNTLAEHSQALLSLFAAFLHRLPGYLCASSLVRGALRFGFVFARSVVRVAAPPYRSAACQRPDHEGLARASKYALCAGSARHLMSVSVAFASLWIAFWCFLRYQPFISAWVDD